MWLLLIWSNLDDPVMPGLRSRTTAPTCPWMEELWARAELAPSQKERQMSSLLVAQQYDVLALCPLLPMAHPLGLSPPSTVDIHSHLPAEQWWPRDLSYHRALHGFAAVPTLASSEITLPKAHSPKRLRHELAETVSSPDFPAVRVSLLSSLQKGCSGNLGCLKWVCSS